MYQAQDGGIIWVVGWGWPMWVSWLMYRLEFDARLWLLLWFIRSMLLEQVMKLGDWYLFGHCLGCGHQG